MAADKNGISEVRRQPRMAADENKRGKKGFEAAKLGC